MSEQTRQPTDAELDLARHIGRDVEDDAFGYLQRLLYRLCPPPFAALDTTLGLATQLEHYIAGVTQERDDLKARRCDATRCPVCEGKGLVPAGFYGAIGVESWSASDITPAPCRPCAGRGVVWRCHRAEAAEARCRHWEEIAAERYTGWSEATAACHTADALHQRLSAALQTLIGKWRNAYGTQGAIYGSGLTDCADELESACGFDAARKGKT